MFFSAHVHISQFSSSSFWVINQSGMKQKLGNCGGGGQCGFCAADFIDSEGWEPRNEYEDKKFPKAPNARLTCFNNIQGPATIRL